MRPAIDIDPDILLEMGMRGLTNKEQASALGIPIRVLRDKIKELDQEKSEVTQYRTIQSIELTKIQSDILDNITPDKIANANLRDLVAAFKILKDKELALEGKPSEIKGLVGYLVEMEKEEFERRNPIAVEAEFKEIEEEPSGGNGDGLVVKDITDKDYLPDL